MRLISFRIICKFNVNTLLIFKMTLVTQILVLMTEFASPVTRKGVSMKLSAIAKKDIMATFVGLVRSITRLRYMGFIIVVN